MATISSELRAAIDAGTPVALATLTEGGRIGAKLLVYSDEAHPSTGDLGNPELTRVVARDARGELAAGSTVMRHYGPAGQARQAEVSVFIESFAPPPQMWIFGAVDFTGALVSVAKALGYRVTVCDAREVFATTARFPDADAVETLWPHELLERDGAALGLRDAVCVLTHDHKFDVPAIRAALATSVGYIGCMGSRRTHEERAARLRDVGVADAELTRVMSPIGLDLGARSPAETAISICAEIIAIRYGRRAPSLRDAKGPIHEERPLASRSSEND